MATSLNPFSYSVKSIKLVDECTSFRVVRPSFICKGQREGQLQRISEEQDTKEVEEDEIVAHDTKTVEAFVQSSFAKRARY